MRLADALMLLVCLAACQVVLGQEMILFADDHYKALGEPLIAAAPVGPVLQAGQDDLVRIAIDNRGRLDGLISTGVFGQAGEAALERQEEVKAIDALNLVASLKSIPEVEVLTPEVNLSQLSSGEAATIQFAVRPSPSARGSYDLPLEVRYERQIDVKVSAGLVYPLLLPGRSTQTITLEVMPLGKSMRAERVRSSLRPGANGSLDLVIRNLLPSTVRNCSATLASGGPFLVGQSRATLGDLRPGQVALASFQIQTDRGVAPVEYQMACTIDYDGGSAALTFPVTVGSSGSLPANLGWLAVPAVALAAIALLVRRRRSRPAFGGRYR
ncbi:MAG: hypothetical protein A4E45_01085 [Methanosaeta sp. PtaB.Bin039]|nr:MAG: hypothetical protein A4E45_01085 [Methanosaeta sp. PtaB.Bin039]HQF15863.1 hypothetical protein [Methanotrichaceae archaeon]HQI90461.1 hypothetical protein [Methanotrichaceae archaeon]HQJ28150.1 hypothetical protein [Methanotrichaceae archaeon]